MQCKDITDIIESTYPKEAALSFDNVGLLAGRTTKEVSTVYLALDASDAVIDHAVEAGADMLITHHPLIFSPLKRVTDEDFISRRILKMIRHDLSYYAMHTNYDVLGMAELSGRVLGLCSAEVLEVTGVYDEKEEGIGRVGLLPEEMTLQECAEYVKVRLGLEHVSVFGDFSSKIRRLAVSPGSGKSMTKAALDKQADVLVTGDIGHHEGIDALEQGMSIIDAGHYGTEYIFIEDVKAFFKEKMPEIRVVTEPVSHPFHVV